MKILTEGVPPAPILNWWVGKRLECLSCSTIVEMEEGDSVLDGREVSRMNGSSYQFIKVQCPKCPRFIFSVDEVNPKP